METNMSYNEVDILTNDPQIKTNVLKKKTTCKMDLDLLKRSNQLTIWKNEARHMKLKNKKSNK